MKPSSISVTLLASLALGACADVTPIKSLILPPVSMIEGRIIKTDDAGFTLEDSSGSIYVKASAANGDRLKLSPNQKVKVYGNLEGGQKQIFDGYVIKPESGEQIIVNRPTPHLGFIMQSDF